MQFIKQYILVGNLHSLLSGKWFIEPSTINGMYPLLQSALSGKMAFTTPSFNSIVTAGGKTVMATKDVVNPKSEDQYVAVVAIKSPIYKYKQECGPAGTKDHQKTIQYYLNDPLCRGVVLDIDSGGGQVSGTPEFYDFLEKSSAIKPIHTYTDGLLCSAAYYLAAATSEITANKRADAIGSIGTMVSFIDFSGYYEKQGAKVITEYATKSTGKNKAFEDLLKGDPKEYIKTVLDPITDEFITDVKAGRKSVKETVFDGSTYNPKTALEMGLIDNIGTLQDVVNTIFNKTKSNQNKTTMSKKQTNLLAVLAVTELQMNDNGTYLNEGQLEAIEQSLTAKEAEVSALKTTNSEAVTAKETAESSHTAVTAKVTEMLSTLGVKVEGTADEQIAALSTAVMTLSKKPGSAHTTPKGTVEQPEENSFVDSSAGHNQLANEIFN